MDNDKENQDSESPIQSVDIDTESDNQDMTLTEKEQTSPSDTEQKPDVDSVSDVAKTETVDAVEGDSAEAITDEHVEQSQELFDAYDDTMTMDVPAAKQKSKMSVYVGGFVVVLALAAVGYIYLSPKSTPSVPQYAEKTSGAQKQTAPVDKATPDLIASENKTTNEPDLPETGVLNNIDDVSQLVEIGADDTEQQKQNIDYGQPPLPVPMSGDAENEPQTKADQLVNQIMTEVDNEAPKTTDENSTVPAVSPQPESDAAAQPEQPMVGIDFAESGDTETLPNPEEPAVKADDNNTNLPMPDNIENLENQATVIETKEPSQDMNSATPDEAILPAPGVDEHPVETNNDVETEVPAVEATPAIEEKTPEQGKAVEENTDVLTMPTMEDATIPAMEEPVVPNKPAKVDSEPEKTDAPVVSEQELSSESNKPEIEPTPVETKEPVKQAVEPTVVEDKQPEIEPVQTQDTEIAPKPVSKSSVTESAGPEKQTAPVKKAVTPVKKEPVANTSGWVLRSAQLGVAWVSRADGSGDLVRIAEGQKHPGLGTIKRIAPINGRWVIEGTKGKIEQ